MLMSDSITERNLINLAQIPTKDAGNLLDFIEILKALFLIQTDLFATLKPREFGFNERRFPYYSFLLLGRIRNVANGLMPLIAQGNEISASILLRSLLENVSIILLFGKMR